MGQIIFPTTLGWDKGSSTNIKYVGDYLRLQYLHEDNTQPSEDLSLAIDTATNLLYWDVTQDTNWHLICGSTYRTLVAQLLYDSNNAIGGGGRIYNAQRGINYIHVRDASTFNDISISDSDYVLFIYRRYSDYQYLYSYYLNTGVAGNASFDQGAANQYFYVRLARIYAITYGLVQSLYFDVLGNRFKSQGEWLSPIIDLGPYINITSLDIQNYFVPTGGDVKIFYRASGSAPSTGSPTAFTDTSGNTLYYYGPNETWTASDWVEVPSGSVPTYKDRFVQLKLQLTAA